MENSHQMAAVAVSTLGRGVSLRQGRYRIVEQIVLPKSQQDQGTAWVASDSQSLSRYVVVREVNPPEEFASNREQAVRDIAQRFAMLGQYPGFPSIIDMFKEREAYYIVLQYIDGKRLSSLLDEHGGVLPEHIAVQYGLQLSEMLQVLSSQNPPIVHGAISPSTVIVDPNGTQVYLSLLPPFTPTNTADLKSTAGYLAPEQLEGKATGTTDIYSLSATLHHAVTGYDPRGRMAFFYPPARQVNPLVSSRLEHLLTKGLHFSPAQRFQQPGELRDSLNRLLNTYPVTEKLTSRVDDVLQTSTFRRRVQRRRSAASTLFAVIALLTILFLMGGIFLAITHSPAVAVVNPGANATATAQAQVTATAIVKHTVARNLQVAQELPVYNQRGIGLSDGNLTFDSSNPRPTSAADQALCTTSVDCKKKASQALQEGNSFIAANLLNAAVAADPTDPEALIYKENLNIFNNQLNSITVVVATDLFPTSDLDVARERLRAVYLAQFEINKLNILPDGYQLRILLANVGPNQNDVQTVTNFITKRYSGPSSNIDHIVSVIGWPSSAQTLQAHNALMKLNIPFFSPGVADSNANNDQYFYHINPDSDTQGSVLGNVAVQKLKAKNVIVLHDPNDPQSVALAASASKQVTQLGGKVVGQGHSTFTEKVTTIDTYQQGVIPDAIAAGAKAIIIVGSDSDAITLTQAINAVQVKRPNDPGLQNLQVLAGDATGSLQVLQRSDVLAKDTQLTPQALQRLSFLSFGNLNANTIVKQQPSTLQSYFLTDWRGTFQNSTDAANNAPDGDQNAMLTYDAMWIIGKALSQVKSTLDSQMLQDVLRANTGQGDAFSLEGTTGRIVFNEQGAPIDKAIYWQSIANDGTIKLNSVFGTYQ